MGKENSKNKGAVLDGSYSHGLAAVKEFRKSNFFPTQSELQQCMRKSGRHGAILVERFKKWLEMCAETDESHVYNQQLFSGRYAESYIQHISAFHQAALHVKSRLVKGRNVLYIRFRVPARIQCM